MTPCSCYLRNCNMKINIENFFIFIFGALSSILIFIIINHANLFKHLQFINLPEEKFLQVRNDFSIYAPSAHIVNVNVRKVEKIEANVQEALSSLTLALQMKETGKHDKASRLFQHALALAPKHPKVLVKYGEYLEYKHDIVLADHMYFQALTINPNNNEAISNRLRTAHIVETIDREKMLELDRKRDALSAIHKSNSALCRAKKEAYFQNIYHSVGIEGNTMTLAQTRSVLETRMAVDGKSIDEHNEILGLDAAMKYINASLVNRNDYITLKDILEIHKRVLGNVDPIEGGEFRRTQVYVGGHIPPGPDHLEILMKRFEQWLNSKQAMSMHSIKYAALAHYKLVHIHPFTDGNGRTSRLLMNTILMRAGYPPVIIPKQQRHKYYDFLQIANEGDIRPFIRFIAQCAEKTLDLYLWATSDLPQQIPMLEKTDYLNSASFEVVKSFEDIFDGESGSGSNDAEKR